VSILVEAAVGSLDDALAAVEGGADRLELCANLDVGGTTPGRALIDAVLDAVDIPVFVMIRARGGGFVFSNTEAELMRRDIDAALDAGVQGVVIGALGRDSRVDEELTSDLVQRADGLPVTFHRAFDRTPDKHEALETLIHLGLTRVLTSAGAPTALEGVEELGELVRQADSRIVILAGGGVRPNTAGEIVERSGVYEVHVRCDGLAERIRGIRSAFSL
jgi:copper homeostasis protein